MSISGGIKQTVHTIESEHDLLALADSIKHDFFDVGFQKGIKTRIIFLEEHGLESVVTTLLNKPVENYIAAQKENTLMAIDAAVNVIREKGSVVHDIIGRDMADQTTYQMVTEQVTLRLGGRLAEQDE